MADLWLWIWLPLLIGVAVAEHLAAHRTDLADRTIRWPANLGLFCLEIAVTSLLSAALVLTASGLPSASPLGINLAALPFWLDVLLVLAVFSFTTYWLHRFSHQLPLLWRFHRIHHSDPIVDPTTSLRHHPGEVALTFAVLQLVILALHPSPHAIAVVALTERCFAAATHTSLTLPAWAERVLGLVFVTPRQHSVHHSDYAPETNTNYGTVVNIWDRVFGTFRPRPLRDAAQFRLGLAEVPPAKAEDLLVLLALPAMGRDPWHASLTPAVARDLCPKSDI